MRGQWPSGIPKDSMRIILVSLLTLLDLFRNKQVKLLIQPFPKLLCFLFLGHKQLSLCPAISCIRVFIRHIEFVSFDNLLPTTVMANSRASDHGAPNWPVVILHLCLYSMVFLHARRWLLVGHPHLSPPFAILAISVLFNLALFCHLDVLQLLGLEVCLH